MEDRDTQQHQPGHNPQLRHIRRERKLKRIRVYHKNREDDRRHVIGNTGFRLSIHKDSLRILEKGRSSIHDDRMH